MSTGSRGGRAAGRRVAAVAVGLTLALAACGGSSGSSDSRGGSGAKGGGTDRAIGVDVCSLLPGTDADPFLGSPVTDRRPSPTAEAGCDWNDGKSSIYLEGNQAGTWTGTRDVADVPYPDLVAMPGLPAGTAYWDTKNVVFFTAADSMWQITYVGGLQGEQKATKLLELVQLLTQRIGQAA